MSKEKVCKDAEHFFTPTPCISLNFLGVKQIEKVPQIRPALLCPLPPKATNSLTSPGELLDSSNSPTLSSNLQTILHRP